MTDNFVNTYFKGLPKGAEVLGYAAQQQEVFQAAYDSFKSNIIDKIHQLSFTQVVEGVFAIVADALLQSVENVLLAAIDVLVELVEGALEGLVTALPVTICARGAWEPVSP
jgi:hypothetical protein